jgi:hypothetical protein
MNRRPFDPPQLVARLNAKSSFLGERIVYAETKIEELAERKLRLDKPELAQEWDKIQHRKRQAAIPAIESTQSVGQDLARSLTLSRVVDEE